MSQKLLEKSLENDTARDFAGGLPDKEKQMPGHIFQKKLP